MILSQLEQMTYLNCEYLEKFKNQNKKSMDDEDNGYFEYNIKYAPFCFKPPVKQREELQTLSSNALMFYLKDIVNYDYHHKAFLPSSSTCEEAAVVYHRKKDKKCNLDTCKVVDIIRTILLRDLNFDVNDEEYVDHFRKNVIEQVYSIPFKQKVHNVLSCFFQDCGLKKINGIRQPLNNIIIQIELYSDGRL
jgi:hypothetical protein